MEINLDNLKHLVAQSTTIFIEPEGEKVLLDLLDLQKQIEDAIDEAKKKLEEEALKINPNFQSIKSDNLKVFYRAYGSRYFLDEKLINDVPKEVYTSKTVYSVIPKAVDEFVRANGGMPYGVVEAERKKSMSFSRREKDNYETEEEI